MRAFDRDLIRGGHYGQRSCEPRSKAEHMAAPTKLCDVKILLANPELSFSDHPFRSASRRRADILAEALKAFLSDGRVADPPTARASTPRTHVGQVQSNRGRVGVALVVVGAQNHLPEKGSTP